MSRSNAQKELEKWLAKHEDEVDPTFVKTEKQVAKIEKGQRFVVTSAQNNTEVDPRFWRALKRYAEERKARLLVIPVRYKNPTTRRDAQDDDADVWWPGEVIPYLVENEVTVHPYLKIMGHVRVQATAIHPLTGLEPLSHGASAIFGHAQIAMQTVPTPQHEMPKVLHTTGSTSVKNYSRTKAGVRGEFHHSLGALVVEKKGNAFHMRSLVGDDDGSFCDAGTMRYYHEKGSKAFKRVEALITGDEHAIFNDVGCREGTYLNPDSIAKTCRPKVIVRHDVFDGYSISHHHWKRPMTRYVKRIEGIDDVGMELEITRAHIDETTPADSRNIIVRSNHDEHFTRWLMENDPRKSGDWQNAKVFHEAWCAMLESATFDGSGRGAVFEDPFVAYMRPRMESDCQWLGRDDPCTIMGILLSLHGDQGPNGTRGSAANLSRIGAKTIIGHRHSPCIVQGCYQVGTSTGPLEYASGPSGWLMTHCVILPNGKRQLLNVIDGRWRG